jgi:hypothetical protein
LQKAVDFLLLRPNGDIIYFIKCENADKTDYAYADKAQSDHRYNIDTVLGFNR